MSDKTKSKRVVARPDPESWSLDELMTLTEAAALFWPNGPLTVPSLRTAVRDGQLAVAKVAGKFLTTRRQIAEMSTCRYRDTARSTSADRKSGADGIMSAEDARAWLAGATPSPERRDGSAVGSRPRGGERKASPGGAGGRPSLPYKCHE